MRQALQSMTPHSQLKFLVHAALGSQLEFWGSNKVDTIIEGAANGRRLLRYRNRDASDADDCHAGEEGRHKEQRMILTFHKDLGVGLAGGLLSLQLFQLLRVLVLGHIGERSESRIEICCVPYRTVS